jgi:hypothetical protein
MRIKHNVELVTENVELSEGPSEGVIWTFGRTDVGRLNRQAVVSCQFCVPHSPLT